MLQSDRKEVAPLLLTLMIGMQLDYPVRHVCTLTVEVDSDGTMVSGILWGEEVEKGGIIFHEALMIVSYCTSSMAWRNNCSSAFLLGCLR
jgi:hypothetical protein